MLATILLLAQIVQSWPWLDSPLVQPGPTICVGECVGPVVWGPAERGRLVVACDMRSDTCSDGRKISTTRPTPVPCEVSPGVWEMVPADTGCYSVRGLESWAANTSYLSYGAQLDHALWTGQATATKVGANYLVCGETFGAYRQRLAQEEGGVVRTSACLVRAGTSNRIRFLAADITSGGVNFDYTLTDDWQTVTATATIVEGGGFAGVRLHPATAGAGCIDVAGCWSVRGDTPGRACWGGEAPVTCAADRHTISTEGWPTTEGEVCIGFTLGQEIDGRRLFDSRPGNSLGMLAYVRADGRISIQTNGVAASFSAGKEWEVGRHHRVCIRRSGGVVSATRDGVEMVGSREFPEIVWGPTANLGADSAFGNSINGSIRSLTVRSFE